MDANTGRQCILQEAFVQGDIPQREYIFVICSADLLSPGIGGISVEFHLLW